MATDLGSSSEVNPARRSGEEELFRKFTPGQKALVFLTSNLAEKWPPQSNILFAEVTAHSMPVTLNCFT
jgi:hypothetical protein